MPSLLAKLAPYDRQPYTQAEKALWSVGQDRAADDVYLERRAAERRQKYEDRNYGAWVLDWLYKLLANYGVRPYRLLVIPLLLIALGTFVFSRPGAIQPKVSPAAAPQASPPEPAPDNLIDPLSWWDALRLSFRLFIPVKVPLGTAWEPSDKPFGPVKFSDLATALTLAGWILVPLGIAALTGLLRRVGP